jgi:hypothetical protein
MELDTVSGAGKGPAGEWVQRGGVERLTAEDVELCTCGRCRVGGPVGFDVGGADADALPMRPVSLAPREELMEAVRSVPLFEAALRLAAWCGEGRQVTANRVLRPALAREAIEELELWKLAGGDSPYADEASRAGALKSLRSAADVAILDDPWRLALEAEFITLSGNSVRSTARRGPDGGELLEFWSDTLGELLEEIGESAGSLEGLPGVMGMVLGQGPTGSELVELTAETTAGMIGLLYDVPDDAWLDFGDVLDRAREEFAHEPQFELAKVLFATSFRELGEGLAALGAVEYEPGDRGGNTHSDLLHAVLNAVGGLQMNGRRAVLGESGRGDGRAGRMRLTPLGRYGLRAYLRECGVPAPLVGEYADTDAGTLLGGIMTYAPEVMRQEVDGWLERRTPADAAVQLLDACAGHDPGAAARRTIAQPVLAELDDPRALRVLRKAANSEVEGCRQVAAATLGGRAQGDDLPVDPVRAEAAALWLLIDGLSVLVSGLEGEELAGAFRENRFMTPGSLDQRVDDLWQVAHPAAAQVLAELGEKLRGVDKRLAKRVRAAANKARSRR